MKGKKEIGIKLALAIFSLIVALYLAELVAFFHDTRFSRTRENIARQNGIPFDTRTLLEVIDDLQAKGIAAYPIVPPSFFVERRGFADHPNELFPLGGISRKTTVYCNENGDYAIYESDEHGFNNPAGIWSQQPKAVLLGDSFAQGACVGPGEDIAGQLRKLGMSALNLGMAGSGPLVELAMLKEYAEFLKPEFVFWIYFEGNDLRDVIREKISFFARYFSDGGFSQDLIHRQAEIDHALVEFIQKYKDGTQAADDEKSRRKGKWSGVMTLQAIRARLSQATVQSPRPDHSALLDPMFEMILAKARQKTSSWGGKLYFVYLPEYYRYVKQVDHNDFHQRHEVLSVVRKLGIPIIDGHQVFSIQPDPLSLFPFRVYGHYTAPGYRLVAEAIDSKLQIE